MPLGVATVPSCWRKGGRVIWRKSMRRTEDPAGDPVVFSRSNLEAKKPLGVLAPNVDAIVRLRAKVFKPGIVSGRFRVLGRINQAVPVGPDEFIDFFGTEAFGFRVHEGVMASLRLDGRNELVEQRG